MRSALRALLLAALVVTAGCSGVFGSDSGPTAETTTTDSGPVAPGLTEDGLADPVALADAHADSLDGESLTFEERRVQRYDDGSVRWRENRTVRAASNRTRYLMVTDLVGRPMLGDDGGRAEVFADGDRIYRSVQTANGSWTDVLREADGDPAKPRRVPIDLARSDEIYVLLNVFDVNGSENVERLAPDSQRYRLRSSTIDTPELLASRLELDEVRNATLEAVVTPDGRVEEYRVGYEGVHDGAVVRGEATVWYDEVGETTVEVPDWVAEVAALYGTDRGTRTNRSETDRNATETTQAS